MRVPNHIKKKMHMIARYAYLSDCYMKEVEEWIEKNGYDIESLRDGCGCSLEELEYGNDIADELCERIEKGDEW